MADIAAQLGGKPPGHNWCSRFVQRHKTELDSRYLDSLDRADQADFKQRTTTMLKAIQPGGTLPMWKKYRAKVIPIWFQVMDELVDTTSSNV
jgi:hypothetical protein